MKARIARRRYLAAGAIAMLAAIVGCGSILDTTAGDQTTAPIRLTEQVAPSLLVVVPGPADMDQLLNRLVTATARPSEDLEMLEAGARGRSLVDFGVAAAGLGGRSWPARAAWPGREFLPADAHYQRDLTHWRGRVAVGWRTVAAPHPGCGRGLDSQPAATGSRGRLAVQPASDRPAGVSARSSRMSSPESIDQAGQRFGARRVILLFVTSLSGMPSTGELNGDDVVVIASYLPTAAAASGAQLNLLNAGARQRLSGTGDHGDSGRPAHI